MKELNLLTYETYFTFKVLVFYVFTLNFALAWYLRFGKKNYRLILSLTMMTTMNIRRSSPPTVVMIGNE